MIFEYILIAVTIVLVVINEFLKGRDDHFPRH